jgi:hypothetical protein
VKYAMLPSRTWCATCFRTTATDGAGKGTLAGVALISPASG